jgi:hypothetical protein
MVSLGLAGSLHRYLLPLPLGEDQGEGPQFEYALILTFSLREKEPLSDLSKGSEPIQTPSLATGTSDGIGLSYRIQDFAAGLHWLGVDQDESDHTRRSATIDPIVDCAALDEHVARLQMDDRFVELHVDLTR